MAICVGLIFVDRVPPSGGSLEIGNVTVGSRYQVTPVKRSPFGGIPRNWKLGSLVDLVQLLKFPLRGDP